VKTGEYPPIDSFWGSKLELVWIVLMKRSFTELTYDRVAREEFEGIFSLLPIVLLSLNGRCARAVQFHEYRSDGDQP
jgi:hypothetical protein